MGFMIALLTRHKNSKNNALNGLWERPVEYADTVYQYCYIKSNYLI